MALIKNKPFHFMLALLLACMTYKPLEAEAGTRSITKSTTSRSGKACRQSRKTMVLKNEAQTYCLRSYAKRGKAYLKQCSQAENRRNSRPSYNCYTVSMGKVSDILENAKNACLDTFDETDPICDELIRASLSSRENGKGKRGSILIVLGVGLLVVAGAGGIVGAIAGGIAGTEVAVGAGLLALPGAGALAFGVGDKVQQQRKGKYQNNSLLDEDYYLSEEEVQNLKNSFNTLLESEGVQLP